MMDMILRRDDQTVIDELGRLYQKEPSSVGRSTIAMSLSCLLQADKPDEARLKVGLSVQDDPENPIGEWCSQWLQLGTITRGTPRATGALRLMRAWAPWEGYGWLYEALDTRDQKTALTYARRAYLLSPFNTYVADGMVNMLLSSGERAEAEAVATRLQSSLQPVHGLASELLLARIEASNAQFGAALRRMQQAVTISPDDSGWMRVQRVDIARAALEFALLLGREHEIVDLIVEQLLDQEPPPEWAHFDVPLQIPAICAYARKKEARHCFDRFRAIMGKIAPSSLPGTDKFAAGAEKYALGDMAGAAKAWRSLLLNLGPFAAVLADAMVTAFERTGETDMAARVEDAASESAQRFNGASLGTVRAARRAAKQGKREEAKKLAQQVIDAWSVADELPPAVDEMKRLLSRLH
jgi:tetratricopeptide (TPR) repeat protein